MKFLEEKTLPNFENETFSFWTWLKENRLFVFFSVILILVALGLVIQNHQNAPAPLAYPLGEPKETKPKIEPLKNTLPPMTSFEKAKLYFSKGKISKAIQLMLEISKNHKNPALRKEATDLLHHYHGIQIQKEKIRRLYLEAYVLFQTAPQKACTILDGILKEYGSRQDAYLQKAKNKSAILCRKMKN
ncbi:MAG: hypothetical protein A3B70_05580 [Deltaproteobacteria bacterium RIFCSPHIGHO2_02_FULL_40_11]|nr:MAG: hypothetical protein A3B70_05580 [Deltaproteobacteria bacterium RIFCSPHIGHO2_02_FULL_40_11]